MAEQEQPSQATTIIIVRHGDVHNPKDVVYGRLPRFRLSDIGRGEAATTAEVLSELPVAAIFSSPQLRARQTAAIIAERHPGLRVQQTALLAEVFSSYQGTLNSVMKEHKYNYYEQPKDPGDETVEQLTNRILSWFQLVLRRYPGQTVIGVSHGDPTMIPRLIFSGIEPSPEALRNEKYYPHKASISRFVFHESGDVRSLKPEVFFDDPNKSAREEREAAAKAARGETTEATPEAAPAAAEPSAQEGTI